MSGRPFGLRLCGSVLGLALVLAPLGAGAEDFTILHSFSSNQGNPRGALVAGSDGKLYGTTAAGGVAGLGSIYVLDPDGSGGYAFSEIYASLQTTDGYSFSGALVEGADGLFYGTTAYGGDADSGTVFRVSSAGVYEKLASFAFPGGQNPNGLTLGADGSFYGTTAYGSFSGMGTTFRFDPPGTLTTLHEFAGADGSGPAGPLLQRANGDFYGLTRSGGDSFQGTVFRMTPAGTVSTLRSFAGTDGASPVDGLVEAPDGNLYGVTNGGGDEFQGVIFRVDASDVVTVTHSFTSSDAVGMAPQTGFVSASDGNLYGTTSLGGGAFSGTIYRLASNGDVTAVHPLSLTDGISPVAPLIEPAAGHLLGTASWKGAGGYGTVFDCDFAGSFTVIHAFFGSTEGFSPAGGVVEGAGGILYGTTQNGGLGLAGTVFGLDTIGNLTLMHTFMGFDGATPLASMIFGPDGRLYGTTYFGDGVTRGSAFAIDTLGNFELLHAFGSGSDGERLRAGLLAASDGNFYGMTDIAGLFQMTTSGVVTPFGGSASQGTPIESEGSIYGTSPSGGDFGAGLVFRFEGPNFVPLHTFAGPPDGFYPTGGLVRAADGFFYGTTKYGGVNGNGIVFRMDSTGSTTTIHEFSGSDGGYPSASLIQASDGFLYGTTEWPGRIFRIDYSGTGFSVVHTFAAPTGSDASLLQASDGSLVGTGLSGGAYNGGTVFRLGLPPATLAVSGIAPSSGPAFGGSSVVIAGGGFVAETTAAIGGSAVVVPAVAGPTQLFAETPNMPPGMFLDVTVTNPDMTSATLAGAFLADFLDVAQDDIFHAAVVSIFRGGITSGCGGGLYCRDAAVTRAQMAVFLVKALSGPLYVPSPATGTVFADVPADAFAADWIEDFASRGITSGCGGGNYCPDASVTRAQMAVFLLKARLSSSYEPPAASGLVFEDVPADGFAAAWIEDLAGRGITAGCSASPALYCPNGASTRGQMAVFLVRMFDLP